MQRLLAIALSAVLTLCLSSGCGKDTEDGNGNSEPASRVTKYEVALVGDHTRIDLLTSLSSALASRVQRAGGELSVEGRREQVGWTFRVVSGEGLAGQAGLAWRADLVLIVVDATEGPLPVHREHVLLARQMAAPAVAIALTRTHLVDDPGLLELEELEMRELLNCYNLPGDRALCVLDHVNAGPDGAQQLARGPQEIVQALAGVARKRPAVPSPPAEGRRFRASVYALTSEEAYSRNVATPVRNGPLTVLLGDKSRSAEVLAPSVIPTGGTGMIEITFDDPIRLAAGRRFALLNRGHIAAVGFVLPVRASGRIEARVHRIVAEQAGVDVRERRNSHTFRGDLVCDDLDVVGLTVSFEDEFGVSIPDADAESSRTIGDVADLMRRCLAKRPAGLCESRPIQVWRDG